MSRHSPSWQQPDRLSGPVPPPDIIELHPQPRVDLTVVLLADPGADPAAVVLSTARFLSAVQAADRKLRLTVDPARSRAEGAEVTLVLTPAIHGSEGRGRLAKVAGVMREMTGFEGITLACVEVVTRG